eukprot:6226749-Prymnesium_polylepis.1
MSILRASNGWEAKRLTSKRKTDGLYFTANGMKIWDCVSLSAMEHGMRLQLQQHLSLRKLLLQTGCRYVAEAT